MLFEILRNVGLVALPFTLYFAWTKIGHKVGATYTTRAGRFVTPSIRSVTLINMKDRPLVVFAIHARIDDYLFNLKEFAPPLIVKGVEAVTVEIPEVSNYHLGADVFEWPVTGAKVHIYIATTAKTIKCNEQGPATFIGFAYKNNLAVVSRSVQSFNDRVYNDTALYAVTYLENKQKKTALMNREGFIDWDFLPNHFKSEDLRSVASLRAAIDDSGIPRFIEGYSIDSLQRKSTRT